MRAGAGQSGGCIGVELGDSGVQAAITRVGSSQSIALGLLTLGLFMGNPFSFDLLGLFLAALGSFSNSAFLSGLHTGGRFSRQALGLCGIPFGLHPACTLCVALGNQMRIPQLQTRTGAERQHPEKQNAARHGMGSPRHMARSALRSVHTPLQVRLSGWLQRSLGLLTGPARSYNKMASQAPE